ncbi:hypothetical protein CERZMDRAFT_95775 [Cercospora zeae-maydis SCOH1-5]|uniref:Uncharacterized protein n=1 Tax=Cercospora zeae-maydis SCOH1-5 TaxID=717836 RepID=A0A6A6FM28_9PEZI|nr:hypothetical protein CERZMDRAFT_95775 [Cercospora zeae-maydis SCOH1-5]
MARQVQWYALQKMNLEGSTKQLEAVIFEILLQYIPMAAACCFEKEAVFTSMENRNEDPKIFRERHMDGVARKDRTA